MPLEYQLDQEHIDECSCGDGEKHLLLPQMKPGGHRDRDDLRNAVGAGKQGNILQAIDYQHPEHSQREGLSQVLYVFWNGFL